MGALLGLKQLFREFCYDLSQIWGHAIARPISFDHIPENDRPAITAVFENFRSDAARGYFDEEHEKALRTFLRGQGFNKFEIKNCINDFRQIADNAFEHERLRQTRTRDQYWGAMALQRSEPPPQTSRVASHD
jgi:hypothetical protein